MKNHLFILTSLRGGLLLAAALGTAGPASAQFVAFNDHQPGTNAGPVIKTHPNASRYTVTAGGTVGGPLTNISDGTQLSVGVTFTANAGTTFGATAADPNPGTPLSNTFGGFVYFGNGSVPVNSAIQVRSADLVTYTFTNLNVGKTYSFRGGAVRGNTGYGNRWAKFALSNAVSFVSAHSSSTGIVDSVEAPADLGLNEVAINTGINLIGDMAGWDQIVPAANGTFSVTSTRYTGFVPGGSSTAGTVTYGYAISGFRLEEFSGTLTPVQITTQPTNQVANQGDDVTLVVVATGSSPRLYQWYRGAQPTGVPILDATNSTYIITNAQPPGDTYYCIVANAFPSTETSQDAVITVIADNTLPFVVAALGQRDQLNVLVSFSEIIKEPSYLDISLTEKDHPEVAIGITNAVVVNGTNLLVQQDTPRLVGTNYALSFGLNSVKDRANNSIEATNIMPLAQAVLLVTTDLQAWKYQADGVAQPADWFMKLFDDNAWSNGLSCFDAKNTGPRTTVGTPAQTVRTSLLLTNSNFHPTNNIPTFYFRTAFHFPSTTNGVTVTIRTMWDDGGILWLNGQVAKLLRATTADEPFATYAGAGSPGDPIPFEGPNSFPLTNIMENGNNVLALEIKQTSFNSSDMTMITEILGLFPSFAAGAPTLNIVPDPMNPGFVIVSWSGTGTLEQSMDLVTWTPVGGNPQTLSVDTSTGTTFYRVAP